MSESPEIPDTAESESEESETLTNSVKESEEEFEPTTEETEETEEEDELEENLAELDDETASLFDGVEESDIDEESEEESETLTNSVKDENEAIGKAYSNGLATLMTVGLDEGDRQEYKPQFKDTFQEFQVDYYAGEVISEQILDGSEDIDPTYALIGTTAIACVTCFLSRPDSDEKISELREKLTNGGD